MSRIEELERCLLGTIFQKQTLIDSHFLERHVTAEMFSKPENRQTYAIFLVMHFQNLEITPDTFREYVTRNNQLDIVGGLFHIAEIEGDGSILNVNFNISGLQNAFLKRETLKILSAAKAEVEGKEEIDSQYLSRLIEQLSVFTEIENETQYQTMPQLFDLLKTETDKTMQNQNPQGVLSGFSVFDKVTNGFQAGELYILAARPSIGKTSLALSMAMNIAEHDSVAFISLETPAKTMSQKIGGLLSDVPVYQIRNGFLNQENYSKIFGAGKDGFDKRAFYLVDKNSLEITELKGIIRHLKLVFGVRIVFLDYIGLVSAGDPRSPVYERQAIVSRSLKAYAREFDLSICALCQVSRNQEQNDKQPSLADLRGSGSIEQDADVVMFIHGSRYSDTTEKVIPRQLIIAKNRNGECLQKRIDFVKATAKYKDHEEEIPQ